MDRLDPLWAGHLYGTNTGRLFLQLEPVEDAANQYQGKLRVADDHLGLTIYNVVAELAGDLLKISGEPEAAGEGIELGAISAIARLRNGGSFSGEWSSRLGTAGKGLTSLGFSASQKQQLQCSERRRDASQLLLANIGSI